MLVTAAGKMAQSLYRSAETIDLLDKVKATLGKTKVFDEAVGDSKKLNDLPKGNKTGNIDERHINEANDSSLTRAQRKNIQTLNNVVEHNLTELDFSGTLKDLQGNPIPKPGGGFWDHKTEMIQSYDALLGVRKGLEGSLKNPNLEPTTKMLLQRELNRTNLCITRIEELFRPYGGVK